jgi:hypothetical protein
MLIASALLAPQRSAVALDSDAASTGTAAPPAGSTSRYTMTAFTNSSESNMYVYDAPDATGFRLLRGPAYTPPSGLIRDPSIMRHTDGRYYLTYTTNWAGNTIGFATSTDRVNWTFLRNHTVPIAGLARTWAPEWFVDSNGSVNVILSASTASSGNAFRPYVIRATNPALTTWSAPTALSGVAGNYIDTFVVKIGATYHAFIKSTLTQLIDYATAPSITGPYTVRRTGNWGGALGTQPSEGQSLVLLDNGAWRIFYDGYTVGRYYFADSFDGFQTWTAPAQLPGLSGVARHFTVYRETVSGGASLPLAARSLQSVNYPGRYVRHNNYLGYLDPVTSASSTLTKQDATFTIVRGLADANCHSFQGTGGRYLRHYNARLRLDADNGTALFRQDATFCARPGSASGTVSLESYNLAGRYLRHRDFQLWVDLTDNTALFRADSSFRAVTAWTA